VATNPPDIDPLGNTYFVANTLERLSETHTAPGQHAAAALARQRALTLYLAQHRTLEAERLTAQAQARG
jgi:hypothetical protein